MITLLYYSSNRISQHFQDKIVSHLRVSGKGLPIVSVTHKPMDLGHNICLTDAVPSFHMVYKQIYLGVQQVKTKFVACCEDDCLYTTEHFNFSIPLDAVSYNTNRWNVNPNHYYFRNRFGMCTCIAPTDLLFDILDRRYKKYPTEFPTDERRRALVEPGKYQELEDFPKITVNFFQTKIPVLTFNHRPSLGGVRRPMPKDIVKDEIPYWGKATDLWREYYG